ncbi:MULTISPECIES: hypothetical protein [unclassified Plantibacter]|uniref:hypothetical protein n=1 Tax=unclassified Plantibacter TaxID=2624265 RepID=UPI0012F7E95C|nr:MULTISPECIES: hypothetical protein [unclassified Plantibacter]
MQWWNDLVEWVTSSEVRPMLFSAALFIVAVVVSSLVAAGASRRALRGIVDQRDREQKHAAIMALVDAATEASVWNSLTPQEQVLSDRAVAQTDTLVRLSPVKGAAVAADWANHQLHEMKRNSATYGYELDPVVEEFRDRLVEWSKKPARARKDFEADLRRWRAESAGSEQALIAEQESWVAKQHHEQYAEVKPAATAGSRPGDITRSTGGTINTSTTQRIIDDVKVLEAERKPSSVS